MAASHDLRSHVTDAITCPICLELFNSPKSLPCLHTFCLNCIEAHVRDKNPADEVACPICRKKFKIPHSGVKGLVCNFFLAGLVELARNTAIDVNEMCLNKLKCDRDASEKCDKHQDDDVRLFCIECQKNICVMCVAGEHQSHICHDLDVVAVECVKQIDADSAQVEEKADGTRNEISRLDMERCTFLSDSDAVCGKIRQQGEELKQLIDAQVNELVLEAQSPIIETCNEIDCLKDGVQIKIFAFETFRASCSKLKLNGKPCDITRAANDLHTEATELLQNDDTLRHNWLPIITFTPMNIQELLDAGQNFIGRVTVNDSTSTSSPISFVSRRIESLELQLAQSLEQIEVCRSQLVESDEMWTQKVNELQMQVKLLKQQEIERKTEKVRSEKEISRLLAKCDQLENAGGDLKVELENSEQEVNTLKRQIQQLLESDNELKAKLSNSEKLVNNLQRLLEECNKSENKLKSKLESFETTVKLHETQAEPVTDNESATNVKSRNSDSSMKKFLVRVFRRSEGVAASKQIETENEVQQSKSKSGLEKELDAEQVSERSLLSERHQPVPRVVHTLPDGEAESIVGLTSLEDELYVLRDKHSDRNTINVYNTTKECRLVRQLSVPGVKDADLWDMTSCKHYRCLYIADRSNCCVHRVELNGEVTKLSLNNKPRGLSVTSQFTVIVTCYIDSKLLELTTEGKQLREINLQSDIVTPLHAIQLSNGQFVVCHDGRVHGVCIVDTNGHVTQSYGGPSGSATVGQLNEPYHLAVDKDEFIVVADYYNSRVLLLSPTLSFVRKIVSRDQLNGRPGRLFLDVDRRRLYVAVHSRTRLSERGRIVVVQL